VPGALVEMRRHREALELARHRDARAVLFCSTGAAGLFALKLRCARPRPLCAVVPHGVLDSLGPDGGGDRWFPSVLRMRNPAGLRYLFLSPTIEAEVLSRVPDLAGATAAIDHPYLFADPPGGEPEPPPLRLGSLGVARAGRGLEAFVEVAREARSTRTGKVSFVHVGPVQAPELSERARDVVSFPLRGWAAREDYEREAARLHYALFLAPPDAYRFSVSGAFLDAVSLLKPVIALRNSFFEHCFEKMGDIGYLCDTVWQAQERVAELSHRFPRSHYRSQQEAAALGARRLRAEAVGAALRAAFERWGGLSGAGRGGWGGNLPAPRSSARCTARYWTAPAAVGCKGKHMSHAIVRARYPTRKDVLASYRTSREALTLFVPTDEAVATGTEVRLIVTFGDAQEIFELEGKVAWRVERRQAGQAPGLAGTFVAPERYRVARMLAFCGGRPMTAVSHVADRVPAQFPVVVCLGETRLSGYVRDVSSSGVFVAGEEPASSAEARRWSSSSPAAGSAWAPSGSARRWSGEGSSTGCAGSGRASWRPPSAPGPVLARYLTPGKKR
jgi:Tfp pilus assembly protein PilZ